METIETSVDTYMASNSATTNYGTATLYIGEMNDSVSVRRGLIKFDLSSLASKQISAAKLRLWNNADYSDNARVLSAYRVLRAWTEAGCTWNKFDGVSDWGTAGCSNTTTDRESAALGSVSMAATFTGGWVEIPLDRTLVQEWIDGVLTNNGLLLQMATETNDCQVFNSSDETYPPQLVVEFGGGFFAIL